MSMNIQSRPVAELLEDPENVRRHSALNLAAIKNSLERFGQQKPIVITPGKTVIAGNGTLAAARDLGWETIDVVETTLTGADIAAFGIADNRAGELAGWDYEALGEALFQIEDAGLLASTGFSEEDVLSMRDEGERTKVGFTEKDETPQGFKEQYLESGTRSIVLLFDIDDYVLASEAMASYGEKHELETSVDVILHLLGIGAQGDSTP